MGEQPLVHPNAAYERYFCPSCKAVFRNAFVRCPLDGAGLKVLERDPLEGETFAQRYIIEQCIGEGATGRVYRARHHRMSRTFAIKVLFGDQASNIKMQSRFAREAEAAARLSHPNVVKVVDFGEDDAGLLYLVMELLEGPSLADVIEQEAPLSAKRAKRIALQLAAGLGHAHNAGLIHRDFKTDNVMITYFNGEEVAKILDFGIAVLLEEKHKQSKLTTEGIVLGTPAFMSPEQSVGDEIDHRTDLFSLGIILYELLAGTHPFGGTPLEIARKNLSLEIPAISVRVPGLKAHGELEDVAFKLLEKRREDRYETADELIAALEKIDTTGVGREATPRAVHVASFESATPTGAVAPLRSSRSWPRYLLIAFGAVAVAGVGYMLGGRDQQRIIVAKSDSDNTVPATAEVTPTPAVVKTEAPATAIEIDAAPTTPDKAVESRVKKPVAAKGSKARRAAKDTKKARRKPSPVPKPVTASAFTSKFNSVGKLVHKLAASGQSESKSLRRSYMSIPFAAALKNENVRRDAMRKLRSIERRGNKLLSN